MTETRIFLEKYKLIEMIALRFEINRDHVRQNKRKSVQAVGDKVSDDYRQLMCKIAHFICHDTETYQHCDCGECTVLMEVLSSHGYRCLSLYDFIAKQNIVASVAPHAMNMAILDFFVLPYLMNLLTELRHKFKSNRILHYVMEYMLFLMTDVSGSDRPLNVFLRQHTASIPCALYVDKSRYRTNEYQTWNNFVKGDMEEGEGIELVPGDAKRAEAFRWHCAGSMVYQLLKLADTDNPKQVPWGGNKVAVSLLEKDYDFIYKSFLSINLDANVDVRFENSREYRYKEIGNIIRAFEKAINDSAKQDNHSDDLGSLSEDASATEVDSINVFCEVALNGMPTIDDIRVEEDKLNALLKNGRSSRHFSLLAWCVFIAKCKHDKIKEGKLIQHCELKVAEHQKDYINWHVVNVKKVLKNRAAYVNFKNDMLCRLGYIRIYNMLVAGSFEKAGPFSPDRPPILSLLSQTQYSGSLINPFVELGAYIDRLITWDDCCSFSVELHERNINASRKESDSSLSWLLTANNAKVLKHKKMNVCISCAIKLYPELMTLAGLAPSIKYTWLKAHKLDELIRRLGPCRCLEINKLKLKKNPEAEGALAFYYKNPIVI